MDINSYKKSNFGFAFSFLSKAQREALSIVYAFCRYADDIVDDHMEQAPELLAKLRADLTMRNTDFAFQLAKVIEDFFFALYNFFNMVFIQTCKFSYFPKEFT